MRVGFGARRNRRIFGIAFLLAANITGCGNAPTEPSGSDRRSPEQVPSQGGAASPTAKPSDALPTLPELGDLQLSCGSPLTFDAAALQQAPDVESLNHPAVAALRDLASEEGVPDRNGWRLVVLTATSAQFLLPASPEEGF